jgi:hypothetical protein
MSRFEFGKRLLLLSSELRLLPKIVKIKSYSTITLLTVLYWSGTWSLVLREGHGLRVFGREVLRKIFWPKREDVAGEWRKFHKEELRNCILHVILLRWLNQGG